MSNSGRKQDPIWIHYEKVKTPDKAGVRAVCKVCRHELQGIPERLKKHAANCTGPPTPALQGLAVAATETGTSSQSEQQQRVETVVDQNDVVVMEVEPLSTSSSASAAVKRPVHGQLAAGTLAAKIPKLNYGLQNYVIRTSAEKRGELDRDVARMVYATNSPFRLVENRHFINLVKDLRPGYQPPSRKDIGGKYLDVIYTEEREKARKNLEGELVCLALDGWSNIHNEPIVCATVTTCLGDIYLVDTTDTSGHPHTAEYLYDIAKQTIENTHNDFGCIICSIVTDNAANVAKMREFLKERLGFNMIAYGCTPHLLNLTSKDLEMGNVKEHVTQVVKYFRNNHFASAQIRQSSCRKLVMPADTRWNTMYDCLNSYCEAWPTLVTICDGHTDRIDVAIANKVRNVVIKRSADEYRLCLKPVACALDKAQSDNCTIAEAVELWKDVKTALHNDTNNSTKRAAGKRYQQAVTPHHMLANLLHPKYRGRNLTKQERETALTVASEIPGLMTLVIKFEAMAPPFHILKFNDEVVNGVTSLHWWKSHRRDFEDDLLEAFEFTQRLMSAVAASAGVERVFSSYGLVQNDYFNPSFKSTPCQKQLQIFQKLWDDVHNDIQVLQSDLNTKIFEDLLKFVQTAHAGFSLEAEQKNVPIHEIPTAALITGVNTPDHAVMFHNLVQLLREWVTPLVAVLRAKDCSQLKQTLSKAVAQFMEQPDVHVDSDDEEDNDVTNMSKMTTTLSSLASWYKDKFTQTHSPSKKKRYSPSKAFINEIRFPPLVVVFEDLEGFTPHVLQDFITITSNYLSRLPMVLVFGIATTVTAIHRLLPNAVSSLLCIEKFQAPPSSEYLTQIIDEVLMTGKFPFKLGNKVFQLLLDLFLYHDFSVLNFIRGIQFAMMDHYYSANYSYMCCSLSEAEKQLKKLTSNHMDDIRQIPSFMRYVETQESSKQADLLTDDEYTKEIILKMLTDIQSYHETYFPVLRCLHAAASRLPRHPLGKQIREVYSLSLKENIFETVDYKESMELLRVLSRDELCDCLKRCQELLHNNSNIEDLNMISDKLANYLLHLQDNSKLSEEVTDDNNSLTEEPSEPLFIPKKTDLYSLRKTLQDMEKKRKLSPYEVLRNEIVDYINDMFRRYLLCPSELPLYEIFYYDSATVIKQQLNAAPRSAINMALSNPSYYLECECCESKSGAITSTMPDTCIAYKLHLECGRLINLYDWMQAFATVLDEDKSQADADEGFDKKPDRIMQARFIRAVSELQFLGFVKPTKRKTDHVARLTWGGC